MDVIDELRKFRKKNKITQEEVASKLRIGTSYLCLLERKRKKPSYKLLNRWCFVFGLKLTAKIVDIDIFNK